MHRHTLVDITFNWGEVRFSAPTVWRPALMNEGKTKARNHEFPPTTRKRWPGYAVALAGTAVAALTPFISWAPSSAVGHLPLYLTFFPVVLAAAVVGGTGPGVLATILSGLTANVLFVVQGGNLVFGAN